MSTKEVCCVAVQVDDGNAALLLMVQVMVTFATASLSTIASGASVLLGVGTMMIIQYCCCRNNTPNDNDEDNLAWELVGTQQWEQHHGTHRQLRQLLIRAFTTLTFKSSRGGP